MILNRNKRVIRGVPVRYLTIDESGRPYYENGYPFIMDAILTDDPELLASIALSKPSNTRNKGHEVPPGMGELKHSRSSREVCEDVLRMINEQGVSKYSVVKPMDDSELNKKENATWEYIDSYKRIIDGVAKHGPPGIYKIRIDHSHNFDTDIYRRITEEAFKGTDKELSSGNPVMSEDSELAPVMQTTDMFVGEHAWNQYRGRGQWFVEENDVIVCNRKEGRAARTGRHRIQGRAGPGCSQNPTESFAPKTAGKIRAGPQASAQLGPLNPAGYRTTPVATIDNRTRSR